MPKVVISLDFDGAMAPWGLNPLTDEVLLNIRKLLRMGQCAKDLLKEPVFGQAFLSHYRSALTEEEFSEKFLPMNELLIDALRHIVADNTTVFVGSARQDISTDLFSTIIAQSSSCFKTMKMLVDFLQREHAEKNIHLSPLLLDDIIKNRQLGATFVAWHDFVTKDDSLSALSDYDALLENTKERDETKITLLYAQMHYYMEQHASHTEPVDFHFFDDRGDILWVLYYFFEKNSHLIPQGMTLLLHQCAPEFREQEKFYLHLFKLKSSRTENAYDPAYQKTTQALRDALQSFVLNPEYLRLPSDEIEALVQQSYLPDIDERTALITSPSQPKTECHKNAFFSPHKAASETQVEDMTVAASVTVKM